MKLAIIAVCLFCFNVLYGLIFSWFLLKKSASKIQLAAYQARISHFKKRLPLIFLNIFLVSLFSFISITCASSYFSSVFPTGIITILSQFFLFIVIDDLWFYSFHRYLHENKFLFKKIHRSHHRANEPLPLEFIYAHPLEWMGGSMGIVFSCIAIYMLFGGINAYIFCVYTFFRGFHDVLLHSCTKSNLLKYIPFFLGNEAHELHHARFTGNYASMLSYLDILFKTKM
ncbi:MAG: sterol desaturase family protein [Coxiellaceae bacterium]|nr:sterol desaturase family protein [Coxiellaceae bacterium]